MSVKCVSHSGLKTLKCLKAETKKEMINKHENNVCISHS